MSQNEIQSREFLVSRRGKCHKYSKQMTTVDFQTLEVCFWIKIHLSVQIFDLL